MYFKRDTDYALRMMLCLAKDKISGGEGMMLSRICRETNAPVTAAKRIMNQFVESELADSCEKSNRTPVFYISKPVEKLSLMDVFRSVENDTELLSGFEKENLVYRKYSSLLPRIENTVYRQFENITLYDILLDNEAS